MNTFTDLEKIVFNALLDICMDAPEADVNELSEFTSLSKDTIKGVVGSLVKKGMAQVGDDRREFKVFQTINPIVNGEQLSFGCDEYDDYEIEDMKI